MKNLLLAASVFLAQHALADGVQYYNQVQLPSSAVQVKLVDAEYAVLATKTATRPIPGCNPNSEAGQVCDEVIVLESTPVIRANVSYVDRNNQSEGNEVSYSSVVFDLGSFSAAEVNTLKAVYPSWKHPFSTVQRDFARSQLMMNVAWVTTTIQVIDVKKSHLCPNQGESGEPAPGCVETIVYKNATTKVLTATVTHR